MRTMMMIVVLGLTLSGCATSPVKSTQSDSSTQEENRKPNHTHDHEHDRGWRLGR